VVETPRFAVGIVILSVIVPEIQAFPVLVAILPLPVVGRRCNRPGVSFVALGVVENNRFAVGTRNCSDICHTVGHISTSGLVGHIAISGYPSMSHLFEFGVVDNFVYRARITVIYLLQIYSAV